MHYVPATSEFVGYVNYQQAFFVSGNASMFGTNVVISIPQLGFNIIPIDLTYEVAVELPQPPYSGSATILEISSWKLASLTQLLASVNQTKVEHPLSYDGYTIHGLLMEELGDKIPGTGYLSIVSNHIIFSTDKTSGLQNVEAILDQVTSNVPSLFDDVTVERGIYATGLTDQNCVALFVGRFATQLNDTEMATKSVIGVGSSIQVSRAFLFPSSDLALQRWGQAHSIYKDATAYNILDSWLVVTYDYPLSRLPVELIGL